MNKFNFLGNFINKKKERENYKILATNEELDNLEDNNCENYFIDGKLLFLQYCFIIKHKILGTFDIAIKGYK